MRIFISLLLLTFSSGLFAQANIIGQYRDYFGDHLQINADSTFKFTHHFDLTGSWTKGKWNTISDTIYFQMIPTYDTVDNKSSNDASGYKLVLSLDETPQRFTWQQYAAVGLSSGGQNIIRHPDTLIFKRGKLYGIKDGKLFKKKQRALWTNKRFPPWFFKTDD